MVAKARRFGAGLLAGAIFVATLAAAGSAARAGDAALVQQPVVGRIDEVGPALYRCWRPPAGSEGSQATVRFALSRDGRIIGAPRLTFTTLTGPDAVQKRFIASVSAAMADCTPLRLSASFGAAIAGEVFALRFVVPGRPA